MYVYIIMPFGVIKRRKAKRSSGMKNRIKKLEKQIIPVLKTFEQRQHDFVAASAPTYLGTPLPYGTPQVWRGSDLYPTLQDGSATAAQNGTVRLGDKITFKSLRLRGEIRATDSATPAAEKTNIIRLIAVMFPDSVVSLTNAEICSTVLQQYPTSGSSTLTSVDSMYSSYKNVIDIDNSLPMQKYKVMHDRTYQVSNASVSLVLPYERFRYQFDIKLAFPKGLVMQYDKFGSDQPSLNQIVFIALSDSTIAPHPDMTLVSRAKYMDA